MKFFRLFPLLLATSLFADEATVVFTPRLATYGPLTNVQITIQPLSVPGSDGVGEMTVNAITNHTGTSTNWSTNLYTPGSYRITYFSRNPLYRTEFTNTFPTNTTGTVYSRDYISTSINSGALVGFSQNAANRLFMQKTNAGLGLANAGMSNILIRPRLYHGLGPTNGTTTSNYVATLTNALTGEWEWRTNASGGGEVSTAQLLVVSNQTQVASNYFQTAVSDLRGATNGLDSRVTTIEGATNSFAKLTAATELTNTVNTVSNRTWTADNWNTNRVNAAITNNNAGAVTLASTLQAQSTTVSALTVQNITDALAFFDDGGLAGEAVIGAGLTLDVGTGTLSVPAVTFFTNWVGSVSNLVQTKQHGEADLTNWAGAIAITETTNVTLAGTLTVNNEVTNKSGLYVGGAGNSLVRLLDTNTALSVSFQAAHGTVRSNLNLFVPTNGMGGNHAGILIATNAGGGTNAQTTLAAIGSGLSLSSDGKTLSASGGSSAFNSTNLYVSNSAVVVADLANFDRLKVYAISNGTIHLSNASSFLKRGRALIQQSTNGLAAITWSVPGGLLQTNVNIGNNTNANALDVLEFEQSFFETNLFAWWPSNFLPRVAFTNSLASGGGGGGPDTYYDVETSANGTDPMVTAATEYYSAVVTVAQAGTATKARVYIHSNSGASTRNVKMALYSAGGDLMASGTATVATTDDGVYKEVTFDTPVAVSATTYQLAVASDHAEIAFYYKSGEGALDIFTGETYAAFPLDPIGTPDFDDFVRDLVIGLYVD